jgi:hypothetical protein
MTNKNSMVPSSRTMAKDHKKFRRFNPPGRGSIGRTLGEDQGKE